MRLLTARLDFEFARILSEKRVRRVDIATAWATEGPGLDALEREVKRRKVRVRTLVGIAGGHTTPSALERLCELGEVRLVDGNSLFHVKLYLFHRASTSSAWIGSANFTGPGFGKNEEVLVETTGAAEAVDWFKNRWKEVDPDSSRRRLKEYCETWRPPTTIPPDDLDEMHSVETNAADKIVFVQEGGRPPCRVKGGQRRKPARGSVEIAGKSFPYKSAQQAVEQVFNELQRRDENFLPMCCEDDRFDRGGTRFIADNIDGLGTRDFREYPHKIGDRWWMSTQTQTQDKWELVELAAEIAELQIVTGKYWKAEAKSRVKVGF